MDLRLTGKVVILTSASRGIGRAALDRFAAEGAIVFAAARASDDLDIAFRKARAGGGDVTACPTDITDRVAMAALVETARQRTGRIDVFVNNAAGKLPAGQFLEMSEEDWLAGWDRKLQWYIRTTQAVFPVMRDQGGGRIVNVVGIAARNPRASYMTVGITNAGLINFTKTLADLGAPHNILVAGVAPGGDGNGAVARPHGEAGGDRRRHLLRRVGAGLLYLRQRHHRGRRRQHRGLRLTRGAGRDPIPTGDDRSTGANAWK